MATHNFKTTNIRGKEYVEVKERIKFFRSAPEYKGYSLASHIHTFTDTEVIIVSEIRDSNGVLVATGTAHEVKGQGNINKTSHIENCESSSWGRALGNLGIGIDTSIATADEVNTAIAKQTPTQSTSKATKVNLKTTDPAILSKIAEGLANCESLQDVLDLYGKWKSVVSTDAAVKLMFTKKKTEYAA